MLFHAIVRFIVVTNGNTDVWALVQFKVGKFKKNFFSKMTNSDAKKTNPVEFFDLRQKLFQKIFDGEGYPLPST